MSAIAHTATPTIASTVSALGKDFSFLAGGVSGGGAPSPPAAEGFSTGGACPVGAAAALVCTSLALMGIVPSSFSPRTR